MNIPLPSKSFGQTITCEAFSTVRPLNLTAGKIIGSNSAANLALKASTTSVVSARVNVQTEKISLPPGLMLGTTFASNFFWMSDNSRTSLGGVVQRACGLDHHAQRCA